jgi:hypothetical protein
MVDGVKNSYPFHEGEKGYVTGIGVVLLVFSLLWLLDC